MNMNPITTSKNRRHVAAAATAVVLGGALALGIPASAPAWAHSVIIASTPTAGETLTALPDAFSVTANEPLLGLGDQGNFALQIRDASDRYYGDGCVSVVDATMSATPALGASGDYTMLWQVISDDGHPVSGEIPFTWAAPDGFVPAPSYASAPVCGEDPNAIPTPAPADSASPPPPWLIPISVVFGLLVLLFVPLLVVRLQRRNGAAARGDNPSDPSAPNVRG